MTDLLHFAPLGSADALEIQRLQKRLFPPDLREDIQEIRAILSSTEKHMVCNFSFGLFDDTRMVAYVFSYIEANSLYHERSEEVLYIKEVALLPGYERMLRQLFARLFQQWSAFAPNTPLEAHVLDDSLRNWKRMVRLFRHYGLSLATRAERNEDGRPPYQLLRLDVDAATSSLAEQPVPLRADAWVFSGDVSVSVVTEARQWLTLKSTWSSLLSDTTDSNVFQSFDYLWLWWKYYGTWNNLRIIVIKRGTSIIGIAPLMLEHFDIYGKTVRKLMFISAPMEMNRPKLIFGHDSATCLPAFVAYLGQHAGEWDILDVDEQLQAEDTEVLREHLRAMGCLVAESETLCPYIELDSTWEEFLSRKSRKMRSNIKRLRRRMASLGEVGIRRVNRWPELDSAMDLHCEIELRSWKARKQLHLSSDKSDYFFYVNLARVFGETGQFELRILECDGRPLASTFGIVYDNVFQSLKIAHDSEYDRYSPGTVLESHELEDLFDADIAVYDFMGSFLTNKLRWTSKVHNTVNIHVYQRQPRLMLFFFIFFVFKRRVKAVLGKLGLFDKVDRLLKRFGSNSFPRY